MRIPVLILLLFLVKTPIFCQPEAAAYKTIADKFELFYNAQKPDSIFGLFSEEMQKALPLQKTYAFITGLHAQAGSITKRQFVKYQGSYASYKTNFDGALFAVNISVDDNGKMNGLFVKPFSEDNLPKLERNTSALRLPFEGEWTVYWGGDTRAQNYHVDNQAQKNAFDIMIYDQEGKTHSGDGVKNEDYYAFGKAILAPCDGEIVTLINGVKDNKPGDLNPFNTGGNMIVLKTKNNEYLVFCHFKHQSIKVKEGQQVKQAQVLGLCGNSGNSSEPHLHFHIQNTEDINKATGAKCYFNKVLVNGILKTDYSPVKGDKIKAAN